eukprot:jgi/Bigna1/137333/aug1.38_g12041
MGARHLGAIAKRSARRGKPAAAIHENAGGRSTQQQPQSRSRILLNFYRHLVWEFNRLNLATARADEEWEARRKERRKNTLTGGSGAKNEGTHGGDDDGVGGVREKLWHSLGLRTLLLFFNITFRPQLQQGKGDNVAQRDGAESSERRIGGGAGVAGGGGRGGEAAPLLSLSKSHMRVVLSAGILPSLFRSFLRFCDGPFDAGLKEVTWNTIRYLMSAIMEQKGTLDDTELATAVGRPLLSTLKLNLNVLATTPPTATRKRARRTKKTGAIKPQHGSSTGVDAASAAMEGGAGAEEEGGEAEEEKNDYIAFGTQEEETGQRGGNDANSQNYGRPRKKIYSPLVAISRSSTALKLMRQLATQLSENCPIRLCSQEDLLELLR